MNAQEARLIAIGKLTNDSQRQYDDIKTQIETAAKKGYLSITIYESILSEVRRKIESEGFKVNVLSHRNEYNVTIDWE